MKALFGKIGDFFKNKLWLIKTRYQLAKDSGQLAAWKPGTKKGNLLLGGGLIGVVALAAVVFMNAKSGVPAHYKPPVTLKSLPPPQIQERAPEPKPASVPKPQVQPVETV